MKNQTSYRFVRQTCFATSLLLCLQHPAQANRFISQAQAVIQQLEPGKPIERDISGGQAHSYTVALRAGEYVRLTADQKGIDLSMVFAGPDGKEIVGLNLIRPGGVESLSAEVAAPGDYRLTVRAPVASTSTGSYMLRAEVRAPADADRKRTAAQALVLRAKQLIQQGPGNASQVVELSEQALTAWRELNDRQMVALSLTEIGGAYLLLAQHEKGFEYAEQAVAIAREARDRGGEQYALTLMAAISAGLNRHDKAIQYNEEALKISREIKDSNFEASLLGRIGSTNYTLGRYLKAVEYFEQALRLAREDRNRRSEARALVGLAMVFMGLSQSEKAVDYLEPALAIFRESKDQQGELMTLSNLGAAHSYLGRYDKATEITEQTLQIARATKNAVLEGNALLTLASIHMSMGRYEKAMELNEPALLLTRSTKDRVTEARVLLQRSNLFGLLNRYDKAIEYAEQALAINREVKYLNGEGDSLSMLGSTYASAKRYDNAIEQYERSLAVRHELKDREGVAVSLSNMAHVFVEIGQHEKAAQHFEQALQIAREIKSPIREAGALAGLGDVHRRLGHLDKAAELLTYALAITRELRTRAAEASTLYRLALTERARGNLSPARSHVEASLNITESIRTELLSPDSRASLLAYGQDAYHLYIDLLMQRHRAEPLAEDAALAFQVSERQRARSLLDLLAEARADVREGVDATVLERERALARQLNAKAASQVQLLSRTHTPEQAAALEQEVNQLESDYERVQAEIRRTSPRYAALTQPQPLSLKEIQQELGPDTVLLEYSLGPERSYLWAVTGDSIATFELPGEKQINEAATNLYNLMTARSRSEKGETAQQKQRRVNQSEAQLPQAARGLSSLVLDPVAAQLSNRRVVVVADGALQYIPFGALPSPNRKGQTAGNRDLPLVVAHEIISLPSASTLAAQRKEFADRKPAPRMIAVIADPVFSSTDERLKVNTPAQTSESITQPQAPGVESTRIIEHLAGNSAAADSGGLRIPRLKFTRLEADQIISIAPDRSNLEALDLKASRATVTSGELKEYRYLHFATHGYLDSERPGLSALVLSMVDEQGKAQDGFLRANDIYNLKLPAELVVLSACQTGLGKEIKGEGLVGLTRGFMYAGAARVVVSLWSVNDKATADLMTKFYQKMLKQGERPAAALRAAQMEMWKQKQWQSPYYWAAFTLQGEWR